LSSASPQHETGSPPADFRGRDAVRQSWRAWRNVWRANNRQIGVLLLAGLIINCLTLALPIFTIIVYDKIIGNAAFSSLWALAIGVAVLMVLDFLLRQSRVLVVEHVGARWDRALDERIFTGLLAASPMSAPPPGLAMAKYREVMSARDFLSAAYLLPISDLPFILLFLGFLFVIGGPIAYVAAGFGVALLVISVLSQWRARRAHQAQIRNSSEKASLIVEVLGALETMKRPRAQINSLGRFLTHSEAGAADAARARSWSGVIQSLMPGFAVLATASTLVVGAYRVESQLMTVGALIACTMLVSRTVLLFGSVAALVGRYGDFVRALHELGDLVTLGDPKAQRKRLRKARKTRLPSPEFALSHVTYRRSARERALIDDVSLRVRPKEFVAVVGRTGSGKSTLLRLLAGRIAPTTGTLVAGGVEITPERTQWLAAAVGFKPQEPQFLTMTVDQILEENGTGQGAAERLALLREIGLDRSLDTGALSLETRVTTFGGGLSGGQRQLLALATALLQSDDALVLDEPLTGLDSDARARVIGLLGKLKGQRTLVVATHDPELIRVADRLIYVNDGKLAAAGSPNDLLAMDGQDSRRKSA